MDEQTIAESAPSRALACAGANLGLLACAFLSQLVASGYNLSVDFTDGQVVFLYVIFYVTPALVLASAVLAALEWRKADREQLKAAVFITVALGFGLLVTPYANPVVLRLQRLLGLYD